MSEKRRRGEKAHVTMFEVQELEDERCACKGVELVRGRQDRLTTRPLQGGSCGVRRASVKALSGWEAWGTSLLFGVCRARVGERDVLS